ncbi:MAG: thioredoxin family protein [Methyloligellaceae bacterium]
MIDRRTFTLSALAAALAAPSPLSAAELELSEDGLHIQPWFLDSFLDLREDHQEAREAGKKLVVLWEQRGCPYCRELHAVNFQKKQIVDFLTSRFSVLQLNLWGSRKVTDFDGTELEERQLARKWAVNFTPTLVFFGNEAPEGKSGKDIEVARMPGYFKPFHFLAMCEFVDREAYMTQGFQRFLQDRFKELEAKGVKPEVW